MIVLGLDPSLTQYGWALHDTSATVGDPGRCPARGRFRTPSKMEFIDRYMTQRKRLRALIRETKPDKVGIEFPIFNDLWSEGMYGLFLFSCEALKTEKCDVVFWTPNQVKAHARETVVRPPGWAMDKSDMVEAAKVDASGGQWNHNEADAYLVARLSARFWEFRAEKLPEVELTSKEAQFFAKVHTFVRGKRAGKTVRTGMVYREDERFFAWGTRPE